VLQFVESVRGLLVLTSREPLLTRRTPAVRLQVPRPTPAEQHQLWQSGLGPLADRLNGQIAVVVNQFSLGAQAIRTASATLQTGLAGDPGAAVGTALWDTCRAQARPRLDDLAQSVVPAAT